MRRETGISMLNVLEDVRDPGKLHQWLATLSVNLLAISEGSMVGWMSPVIPQLKQPNNPVRSAPLTDEDISWLSTFYLVAGLIMTPFCGNIVDKLGRKNFFFLTALTIVTHWALTLLGNNTACLLAARFIGGVGSLGVLTVIPIYVAEISTLHMRGTLNSTVALETYFGLCCSYILGAYVEYHWYNLIAMILPVLFMIILFFLPETPIYLVRSGRIEDAKKSLMWLRGGNNSIVEEEIVSLQNEAKDIKSSGSASYFDIFKDKASRRGLIIAVGLYSGQQLTGYFCLITYSSVIFKLASSSISPNLATIIVGIIQLIGSCITTLFMKKLGRKTLLLVSTAGTSIAILALAIYCYLSESLHYDTTSFRWIPVTCLSTFMIAYSFGIGPCALIVSSEIFRRDVSSIAMSLSLFMLFAVDFVQVKFFNSLVLYLQLYGCFFLFGVCSVLTFFFVLVLVPETKGKSLESILAKLGGNLNNPKNDSYARRY